MPNIKFYKGWGNNASVSRRDEMIINNHEHVNSWMIEKYAYDVGNTSTPLS